MADNPRSPLASALAWLDYDDSECLSLLEIDDDSRRGTLVPVRELRRYAVPQDRNVWLGLCPMRPDADGRGKAADVVRVPAVWADLDVKPGGFDSFDSASATVDTLSRMLDAEPLYVTMTGHGLQPVWALTLEDSHDVPRAARALRRFGTLVATVAQTHGATDVDPVFDLARVLRVPGSVNHKSDPIATAVEWRHGDEITLDALEDALDGYGIGDAAEPIGTRAVVSTPDEWTFADSTCRYAAAMVTGWSADAPAARHPWLIAQATRLEAARRHGCLTESDYAAATRVLAERFRVLVDADRGFEPVEVADAFAWARDRISRKSDDEIADELGGHSHDAVGMDEETFWTSRTYLAHVRQAARATRVGPWALLGTVLARVAAETPPGVRTPALVGDAGTLNLFVGLVGESGAGKTAAIGASRTLHEWTVEQREPGSGEGLVKIFAALVTEDYVDEEPVEAPAREYSDDPAEVRRRVAEDRERPTTRTVKRTRRVVRQINDRAFLKVDEIDSLTATTGRSGSTLWPVLRSVWSGESLGWAYSDPTKAITVEAHSYRATMVVGVQPKRAGTLLDGEDGGTPQRFLWLPLADPDAPDVAPAHPGMIEWRLGDAIGTLETLEEPLTHTLGIADSVRDYFDRRRLAALRGERLGDAVEAHGDYTRVKVAGVLALLDKRDTISEDDWTLAGFVMDTSSLTLAGIRSALAGAAETSAVERGRADGKRQAVAEDTRAEETTRRAAARIAEIVKAADPERVPRKTLKRRLSRPQRGVIDAAVERALAAGTVSEYPVGGTGEPGSAYGIGPAA